MDEAAVADDIQIALEAVAMAVEAGNEIAAAHWTGVVQGLRLAEHRRRVAEYFDRAG